MSTKALLQAALETAVPLWILRIQQEQWSWERMAQEASRCSSTVAEHGDNILYRAKKPGETTRAFNDLALGIAIAAHVPGGIKIFGIRFEAPRA